MNNKISIILIFLILFFSCSSGIKSIPSFNKSDDFNISWSMFNYFAKSSPKTVLSIFSQTIPLDSIAPYFNYTDLYKFVPNKEVVNNFIDNNLNPINIPKDAYQPFAYVINDSFINSKTLKEHARPQIDFKTMDTLDNTFIRISRFGYNKAKDSALVYLEFYPKSSDFGEVYFFTRTSGSWIRQKDMFLWVQKKIQIHNPEDSGFNARNMMYDTSGDKYEDKLFAYPIVTNVEEDTILRRKPEEIYQYSLPALKKIKAKYNSLFQKPRPKGSITIMFHVNCSGILYNFQVIKDEIKSGKLLDNIIDNFSEFRYNDNMRTNRCGEVEVMYSLVF